MVRYVPVDGFHSVPFFNKLQATDGTLKRKVTVQVFVDVGAFREMFGANRALDGLAKNICSVSYWLRHRRVQARPK